MAQLIQVTFEISPAGAGTVARSGVQAVPMVFPQGSEPGTNIISSIEHATYTASAAAGYRFEKFSFSGTATRDVDYGGGDVRHYTFTLTEGFFDYSSNPTTLSPQYSYYNGERVVPFYLEWDSSGSHFVDQMTSLHCKVIFVPDTPPQTYTVTASAVPARFPLLAKVGSNPEGNPSTGTYAPGTSVQVSARSLSPDYIFIQWNDGSRQNPRGITVTSDITLTARFMPYPASNLLINSHSRTVDIKLVSDPVSGKLVVDYVPSPS